tara:strand:- start:2502 stop:2807 length:306 start_codon:yes stop_codon:yes gene_type:complete
MNIKTNNKFRDILRSYDLTEQEREEFDYYTVDELYDAMFFRYKGDVFDLGEFMRCPDSNKTSDDLTELTEWDGYMSDSYFSGVVIRYDDNIEQIQVGRFYS